MANVPIMAVVILFLSFAITATLGGPPMGSSFLAYKFDRNATDGNVTVNYMTPHEEVVAGKPINLNCKVEFFAKEDYSDDEDYDGGRSSGDGGADTAVPFVEWTFVSGDVVETLAARGVSLSARWSAQRRASTNFVNDMTVIEEHYLVLGEATMKDTGVYICRVQDLRDPSDPDSGVITVASKHTVISVLPGRRRNQRQRRPGSNSRGGRRRHRNNEATSSSGSAGSADRERRTQSLRAPSSSSNSEGEEDSSVTLGPVSERIVMVRQGMNVVLECRDADADSRVYWTKHGDPKLKLNETGRQLRLFAVDRWDSGLYMCSTSLSEAPHHNVTVRVKGPPVVTAPRHGDGEAGFVARQALGHPAKLRCKVAAVPGPPSLSWYHVIQSSIQPREELRRERLRSGDDYTISIDEYRDGAQEFSLRIPSVAPEHLEGSFRCEARNELGDDGLNIVLAEAEQVVDFDQEDWTFVKDTQSLVRTGTTGGSPSSSATVNQRISSGAVLANLAVVYVALCAMRV